MINKIRIYFLPLKSQQLCVVY